MLTAPELSIQRNATKAFIDADPTEIVLRYSQKSMVNGTLMSAGSFNRLPQTFKMSWAGDTGIVSEPPNGTRRFDFVIIGEHDADVSIGDFWKVGDQEFRLTYLYPSNGYEVKAGGLSHGPSPT